MTQSVFINVELRNPANLALGRARHEVSPVYQGGARPQAQLNDSTLSGYTLVEPVKGE